MRISFDLDDTLVCPPHVPAERLVGRWRRWRYPEAMRLGTVALMGALVDRGCQVWIYTTSYRSPRYIRGWFRCLGIPIGGVVNQERHDRVVGRHGPSKYPPAFGIDLHVDDSEGVRIEGERHGFAVLVVAPDDETWAARILGAVEASRS
jgi:hypothetical protein